MFIPINFECCMICVILFFFSQLNSISFHKRWTMFKKNKKNRLFSFHYQKKPHIKISLKHIDLFLSENNQISCIKFNKSLILNNRLILCELPIKECDMCTRATHKRTKISNKKIINLTS